MNLPARLLERFESRNGDADAITEKLTGLHPVLEKKEVERFERLLRKHNLLIHMNMGYMLAIRDMERQKKQHI
jgi:hypothetical protein